LLVAAPLMALVAVAVRLTSPGPALYVQERLGRHGHPFRLYKFRTMVAGAEEQTGPVWARENDPRVTGLGCFLRRHRLDELPQLWNVLRGDMSLVGPRPERAHFYDEFRKTWPLFDRRLEVRPGLVSLSHVLGGYDMAPDDRLRYDLMYIGSVSAATDLKVLLASVRVVVGGKGAR
jgi:lipopolysaccharide/colanic/teichoic acid biosynthesis glycosyltransferase